jgi:two-component system chemotaxis response regulator CheY
VIIARYVEFQIQQLTVLVVDDNAFMRKVVRNLLNNIGVKKIFEAADGIAGIEAIRHVSPDVVVLDWKMPLLNGPEFVRIVRSPGVFPLPDLPIIMLTAHGERRRVVEAVRIGVNEFLCKPVSAKALLERLISILAKPRANVQVGDYYGPEPRKLMAPGEPGLPKDKRSSGITRPSSPNFQRRPIRHLPLSGRTCPASVRVGSLRVIAHAAVGAI